MEFTTERAPGVALPTVQLDKALAEDLETLDRAGLRRSMRTRDLTVIDFSSNDYLGLAADERITSAMQGYQAGAGAARLISGNYEIHNELERSIAEFKGAESAHLFPT